MNVHFAGVQVRLGVRLARVLSRPTWASLVAAAVCSWCSCCQEWGSPSSSLTGSAVATMLTTVSVVLSLACASVDGGSQQHRVDGAWRSQNSKWRVTADVDAFQGGRGGGGAAAHWQTLGRAANATACAALCGARSGNLFAWHHSPEQMCHCSAEAHGWAPASNARVDSGCRADGCLPPGPPPPPGLPAGTLAHTHTRARAHL